MATIKSFTDLSQSRKLAEILPLESADMCYEVGEDLDGYLTKTIYTPLMHTPYNDIYLPCWSLASLLEVLPEYNLQRTDWENKTEYKIVVTVNDDNYASKNYDNPLDACYEMIIRLNELKML